MLCCCLLNGVLNVHMNLSAECPSTLSSCEELMLRLEQMQALLKTEPEEADDETVDIVTTTPPCQKLKVKEEEQETDTEPKFFLGPCMASQFVSEAAQQVRNPLLVYGDIPLEELINSASNLLTSLHIISEVATPLSLI